MHQSNSYCTVRLLRTNHTRVDSLKDYLYDEVPIYPPLVIVLKELEQALHL